jgi:Zn-dependent protease with chaperone function
MSFLLMVFLVLVCLPDSYPAPRWGITPGLSAALTGVTVLLIGCHAFFVSRRITRPLARDPSLRESLLPRYERGRFIHQLALFGVFGLALLVLGWGWSVRQFWRWGPQALPGTELLTLAPFLVGLVLSWLCFYDADRAAHLAAQRSLDDAFGHSWLEPRPATPAPSFGGRWAYVLFQMRQKLALVCIPVLLLIVQKEVFRLLPHAPRWQMAVNCVGMLALAAVFVSMPWIVRLILGLKPLPRGVLRDRLTALAKRLDFRCSDILLWNTRSGMANAMVIGILPWLRYVVFTDRLVEEFPEEEIEAVFGHEVGHIRHHHMLYYLGFLVASMAVLGMLTEPYLRDGLFQVGAGLAELFPGVLSAETLASLRSAGDDLMVLPVIALMVGYIFLVFGFLSRRCERQADVFGCRAVSCGCPDCPGHAEDHPLPARGVGLCPTGIQTFIRALEKVAVVNGISRDRPGFLQSWQHSTIAKRVAFLQSMLDDPRVEGVFQRRVALIKWVLFAVLTGALLVLFRAHYLPGAPSNEARRESETMKEVLP